MNSESYIEYIGKRNVHSISDAENYISEKFTSSYAACGFGFYLIELSKGKVPIGICGLVKRDWLDDVDLGFALLPEFENKGYAYESAAAMLNYSFSVLHLNRVAAITQANNASSIKLLRKLDMEESEPVIHPTEKIELMFFSCTNSASNK